MDARFQRRVQRYGWDKAVGDYETGWREQLEPAQSMMLEMAALQSGERVLDVACGTGLVSFRAADAVGDSGAALGFLTLEGTPSEEVIASVAALEGIEDVSFLEL